MNCMMPILRDAPSCFRHTRGERGYDGSSCAGRRISFCVGVAERVGCVRRQAGAGLGGALGEIPAASAGMTDLNCVGMVERVWVCAASGGRGAWWCARRDTRGERGYDGSKLRGYGGFFAWAWRIFCAGVADFILRGGGGEGMGVCGVRRGAGLGGVLGEIPAASAGMTDLNCAGMTELRRGLVRLCSALFGGDSGWMAVVGVRSWLAGGEVERVWVCAASGGRGVGWCARRDTRGERGYDGSKLRGYGGFFAWVWRI